MGRVWAYPFGVGRVWICPSVKRICFLRLPISLRRGARGEGDPAAAEGRGARATLPPPSARSLDADVPPATERTLRNLDADVPAAVLPDNSGEKPGLPASRTVSRGRSGQVVVVR
nr:unnamed protein product [Digitaria exilis]